jgi:hypothetical protein
VREIRAFLAEHEMDVTLVVFTRECYEISAERYARVQSFIDEAYADSRDDFSNAPSYRREERPVFESSYDPDACFSASYSANLPASFEEPRPPAPAQPKEQKASRPKPRPLGQTSKPSGSAFRPDRMLDESFSQMLLRKIDERGMKDADCYKRANVDRKLFSKIRSNPDYRPSKATAIAFAIALELNRRETDELLKKAGYALSRSNKFDVIIQYYIDRKIYNIFEINETLFFYDQCLLGA